MPWIGIALSFCGALNIVLCMSVREALNTKSGNWSVWGGTPSHLYGPNVCRKTSYGFGVYPPSPFRECSLMTLSFLAGIHGPQFSLQTTHVLRVYKVFSIHGWSKVKPAKDDEQPLTDLTLGSFLQKGLKIISLI